MAKPKLPDTRPQLLKHLRTMKTTMTALIGVFNVPGHIDEPTEQDGVTVRRDRRPDEHPEWHAANWEALQRAAATLRAQADALHVFAVRQGRVARERAHPANQPPTDNGD